VDGFLPAFDPGAVRFRASHPVSQAVAVLGGGPYSYFRYETHLAAEGALGAYDEAAAAFAHACGRSWPAVDAYRCEDAEVAFFLIGSLATRARDAVDRLREAGMRVGLVRPRLLRPYPAAAIARALEGVAAVAVIDQNLSMGMGGVLHAELASALYGRDGAPRTLASFIGGLGGRSVALEEFREMAQVALAAAREGRTPPRRLLYTAEELRELRKLQAIAHDERGELAGKSAS
jgi:pyruvate ferredoxin oxidoreductase alpha subunit